MQGRALTFPRFSAFGARLQLAGRCDRSDSSFRTYVIFFRKTDGASLLLKIVGPVRAAIRRKVQVRKVREKPGGRLFTTFTDVLRPLTSLDRMVSIYDTNETVPGMPETKETFDWRTLIRV